MAAAETGVRKGVCVVKMDDFRNLPGPGRKIAVVGSGISGLACAWLLSREHRVTLFEAADRVGGHTNTVNVTLEGVTHPVDTGFLVFNRRTYPNLCALFALLGVQAVETEMSFSVSLAGLDLEWAGSDLNTVFAQRRNLLRPAMWGMIGDILRFNRETTRMAQRGERCALSLGAYLDSRGYGQAFRDWYLLPMAAAIWSCPADAMLAYPVETFVRFCHNHGLLQIINRPRWLTARQGLSRACDGEVVLHTMPRIFGYVFNPVSFWFCHDAAGSLRAVLAEVNNTFGERHNYLIHHDDLRPISRDDTLQARKVFHVSPFFPVQGSYRFRFGASNGHHSVDIDYYIGEQRQLRTRVSGQARMLDGAGLRRWLLRHPLMTFGVVLRIHWQALRLALRRVPFFRKPLPPLEETSR